MSETASKAKTSTTPKAKMPTLADIVKINMLRQMEDYVKCKIKAHITRSHENMLRTRDKVPLVKEAVNIEGIKSSIVRHRVINQKLQDLSDSSKQKHVTIDAHHHQYFNDLHLAWIERHRGSLPHSGAEAIEGLHKIADEHNCKVTAVPWGNEPRLVKYYKDLGYKHTGDVDDDGPVMMRKPQKNKLKEEAPTNCMGTSSSTSMTGNVDTFDPLLFRKILKRKINKKPVI